MGRLEDLIRQSDELVGKLRAANTAVRQSEDIATQAQASLTEAVHILRSRKDDYNRLHAEYQHLQGLITSERQQQARVRAQSPTPSGPRQLPIVTAGRDRFYFDERLSEFRDVNNPHRSFALNSDEGQALFAIYVNTMVARARHTRAGGYPARGA